MAQGPFAPALQSQISPPSLHGTSLLGAVLLAARRLWRGDGSGKICESDQNSSSSVSLSYRRAAEGVLCAGRGGDAPAHITAPPVSITGAPKRCDCPPAHPAAAGGSPAPPGTGGPGSVWGSHREWSAGPAC